MHTKLYKLMRSCMSRNYPYSPAEGIRISWGLGDSVRPNRGGGMDIFRNYTLSVPKITVPLHGTVTSYFTV